MGGQPAFAAGHPAEQGDGRIHEEGAEQEDQSNAGSTWAFSEATASAPKKNPRKPDPTSPMKSRAGGQFQTRNPAAAAAGRRTTAPKDASRGPTRRAAATPTVTASAAARPSLPS